MTLLQQVDEVLTEYQKWEARVESDQAEVENFASIYNVPLCNDPRWYGKQKKHEPIFNRKSESDFKSPGMASRILTNFSEDRSIGASKANYDSIIPAGIKAPRR